MPIFAAETSLPNGGLTTLDLVVIGLYLAGMLCMGFVIAMRQKSTDDFFVGGRNLPVLAALDAPRQRERARETSEEVIEIVDDLQTS